MNLTLLKKEWKANALLLVLFLAVLSVYAVIVVALFDPKMSASLKMMTAAMPQLFSAFGMGAVGTTLLDFIGGYLYGMLFTVFPGVFLIILTNRLITRYVDQGSLVCLLSSPNTRRRIVLTQGISMLLMLLLMVGYLTALLLLASHILFPGALQLLPFLRVNAGLLGFLVFFGGICFFFCCLCNESGSALSFNTAVLVYCVLLQMLANMGEKFQMLRCFTPLSLFDYKRLAAGNLSALLLTGALYLTGIVFFGCGVCVFERKDLPL